MLVRIPTTSITRADGSARPASVPTQIAIAVGLVVAAAIAVGMLLDAPAINLTAPAGSIVLALAVYYGLPLTALVIAGRHLRDTLRVLTRRLAAEPAAEGADGGATDATSPTGAQEPSQAANRHA